MFIRFGTPDGRNETFWQINVRSFALIIPAIVLGHYLDEGVQQLQARKKVGDAPITYVLIQSLFNIALMYGIHKMNYGLTKEFQMTIAGLFFSALFFAMQTNFIDNIKKVLH